MRPRQPVHDPSQGMCLFPRWGEGHMGPNHRQGLARVRVLALEPSNRVDRNTHREILAMSSPTWLDSPLLVRSSKAWHRQTKTPTNSTAPVSKDTIPVCQEIGSTTKQNETAPHTSPACNHDITECHTASILTGTCSLQKLPSLASMKISSTFNHDQAQQSGRRYYGITYSRNQEWLPRRLESIRLSDQKVL